MHKIHEIFFARHLLHRLRKRKYAAFEVVALMRTLILAIVLAFISLSCARAKELTESDFNVLKANSDVRLELSEPIEEVVRRIGQPITTKTIKKSDQEPRFIQYVFQGLTVVFSEYDQKVILLTITGPEFTTSRQISVGATMDRVKSTYGPVKNEWPKVIQYQLSDVSSKLRLDYLITFSIEGGVVKKIDINRSP